MIVRYSMAPAKLVTATFGAVRHRLSLVTEPYNMAPAKLVTETFGAVWHQLSSATATLILGLYMVLAKLDNGGGFY